MNNSAIEWSRLGILKRNHDMVDASDIVLSCLDTRIDFHYDRSGTAATLRYAEAHGKEIFLNTPKKMENVERRLQCQPYKNGSI